MSATPLDDEETPLLWADDEVGAPEQFWRVLIVDDEPAVHEVSSLVLNSLRFRDRRLSFLNAYDGAQARRLLADYPDIAVILLDVVMETDDAGLRLVRHIREELGNDLVRIILRTGQAGLAPERLVILDYDINDYKEKTDLTAQKLSTAVVAALRGYLALTELAELNRVLEDKVAQRTQELVRANARLQQSLSALEQGERAGRQVQFKLLPKPAWTHADFHFSHLLMPSEFMSGDFVDYFAIDDNRVGFYIADVSGHGVASAFVTVYLKRFIATALDNQQHGQASAITNPALLLAQLNSELLRDRIGKHIAIFYGVIDTHQHTLHYANAGATPFPLLADAGGCRYLEARSTPAGMLASSEYHNHTQTLSRPMLLLLCSDGVLEILPEHSTEQRCERLRQVLSPQVESIEQIRVQLGLKPEDPHPDDVALLLIRWDLSSSEPSV
jgi:phosphoserine phosphatase RsbU/P